MANIEALKRVADILESKSDEDVSLVRWKCGTTACAIGHAASDPWFIDRGFRLGITGLPEYRQENKSDFWPSWIAVERFFDLSSEDSHSLFSLFRYLTTEQKKEYEYLKEEDAGKCEQKLNIRQRVIERIREFVKKAEETNA